MNYEIINYENKKQFTLIKINKKIEIFSATMGMERNTTSIAMVCTDLLGFRVNTIGSVCLRMYECVFVCV